MPKLIGSLFIGVLLLFECGQVLSQSIPPSKLGPLNPVVTRYLHIFSCYDVNTGNLLNCQVFDELVGILPPASNPAHSGGHTHGGIFPLTDLSVGSNGFVCLSCSDFNQDPFIVQAFTNSSTAVVLHTIPQFSGRLQVQGFLSPPPGWVCVTNCNFQFVEEIGVDGLSDLPPGQNYAVVRSPGSVSLHPQGTAGTSDALLRTADIAQGYFQVTGRGLSINDLSLPRGGKFDLAGTFGEGGAHSSHRTGKDADFNSTDLGGQTTSCFSDKQLQQILIANNVGFKVCHTGGAYHVRFN